MRVVGDMDRVARLEVALLRTCAEIADLGDDPLEPIRLEAGSPDSLPALGSVPAGSYGLYGRAWDDQCRNYAAGCDSVYLEAEGDGTLDLFLREIAGLGCDAGEVCTAGTCAEPEPDAGQDAGSDSGLDAGGELDAGADAGCQLPAVVGSVDTPGQTREILLSGSMAYVTCRQGGLAVLDLSAPAIPQQVGSLPTVGAARGILQVDADHLLVADDGAGILTVDVSNPNLPTVTHSVPTAGLTFYLGWYREYLVVTLYDAGIAVFDAIDPLAPTLVGSVDIPADAAQMVIRDSYVYTAGDNSLVDVVDVSDPGSPRYVTSVNMPASSWDIELDAAHSTLLVATRQAGLQIIDVSRREEPALVGALDTAGDSQGVMLVGSTAWMSDGNAGLQLVDVSVPNAPVAGPVIAVPGNSESITMASPLAFVGDDGGSVQVVDLGCLAP